jgi:hypothetical protein
VFEPFICNNKYPFYSFASSEKFFILYTSLFNESKVTILLLGGP